MEKNRTPTNTDMPLHKVKELKILNRRKGKGYFGELLIEYNNGEIDWTLAHGYIKVSREQLEIYFLSTNLTWTEMGYAIKLTPNETLLRSHITYINGKVRIEEAVMQQRQT